MAKDKISDYSSTANSNTDIAGINIDEGCAPSGINDAIRTLMAQLKTWQSGGQDVYIHPAGSASAPSITANGDTNTGIFFPAADTVGISTGGTERARVDSSGNLGLGVTPSAWSNHKILQAGARASFGSFTGNLNSQMMNNAYWDGSAYKYIGSSYATYYSQVEGVHAWYTAASGTAGNTVTFNSAMAIDTSGNLALGNTTSLSASSGRIDLTVNGTSSSMVSFGTGGTRRGYALHDGTDFSIASETAGAIRFLNNGAERARIDSSGNLLVGTTNSSDTAGAGFKIRPTSEGTAVTVTHNSSAGYSTYHVYNLNATNNGYRFYVGINGGITNYSGNNTNLSDERTKTNIELAGGYLEKVCSIPVKLFNYKDETEGEQRTLGVIAQDVEVVAPELVNQDGWLGEAPEGEAPLKSIYTTDMMFALMKSIQELNAKVDAQAAEIAALKGQA